MYFNWSANAILSRGRHQVPCSMPRHKRNLDPSRQDHFANVRAALKIRVGLAALSERKGLADDDFETAIFKTGQDLIQDLSGGLRRNLKHIQPKNAFICKHQLERGEKWSF